MISQRTGLLSRRHNVVRHYNDALEWIKRNTIPEKGIPVSSRRHEPYPEVTGYLIPTLMDAGEYGLARQYAEFLAYMQRPDGSFAGPDGRAYAFDTGQALRGLVRASRQWEKYRPYAGKAAEYVVSCVDRDGRIPSMYGDAISEYVHVFILPALLEAGDLFRNGEYLEAASRSVGYYKAQDDILAPCLTHFYAYILDGFIDAGEAAFVRDAVKQAFSAQRHDGSVTAYPGVGWVCSTGLAQLAIIADKLGMCAEADRALRYLCKVQNSSGGFYGSYGAGAKYFPREEISWAGKFFLDAIHANVEAFFNSRPGIFPGAISPEDGRLRELIGHMKSLNGPKVLDAGCGKGRFAIRIKEAFPGYEVHGVDISEELLKAVPETIITKQGSILCLPYDDETFDCVFCVEALEHTLRTEKAIAELCRVLKPGGTIVIIDKNVEKMGRMSVTSFEQWFDEGRVRDVLLKFCSHVEVRRIGYGDSPADGLFLSWAGVRGPGGLGEEKWHEVMVKNNPLEKIADDVRKNHFPVWAKPLILHTSPGDRVLELGSGTGLLSAILGVYGREPCLLDYSADSIAFDKLLFDRLGLAGQFYRADVLDGLPLGDDSVDWTWSSGLLEHFADEQIVHILRESARVSKKGVMSLVPNAGSLLYRAGKLSMERNGSWKYGREEPRHSMKAHFRAAGLQSITEFSVGSYHAIEFFGPAARGVKDFYDSIDAEELEKMGQGYLLFTYGEKAGSVPPARKQ